MRREEILNRRFLKKLNNKRFLRRLKRLNSKRLSRKKGRLTIAGANRLFPIGNRISIMSELKRAIFFRKLFPVGNRFSIMSELRRIIFFGKSRSKIKK